MTPDKTRLKVFHMRHLASFILLIFLVSPAIAQTETPGPEISSFSLENGMRLVVIPDRRAPVATHMIWYKVGAADDPPGRTGIAHFLEHLMFKNTKTYQKGEFSRAVSSIGGQENAFTSYDYTAYYQKVSPSALGEMMKFEADRMRNVVFAEDEIFSEKQVVLEERSSRIDTSPGAILAEFTVASMHVNHPYGRPVIGWENEIRKLEKADLQAFYEKWYQPWNAIVVVAGDVEPQEVFQLARQHYGVIAESSPPVSRIWTEAPEAVVSTSLTYRDNRVTSPSWQKRYRVPSFMTAEPGESEALDLLSTILGGSVTSRIEKQVVLEKKIATSAGAFYRSSSRGETHFGVYGSPRGETELEAVIDALEQELDRIIENGVTQDELDRARQSYLRSIIYSQDSQVTMARIFGSLLSIGATIEDFKSLPARLNKVTVEEVNAVAKKYLKDETSVESYLLPAREKS